MIVVFPAYLHFLSIPKRIKIVKDGYLLDSTLQLQVHPLKLKSSLNQSHNLYLNTREKDEKYFTAP